MSDTAKITPCVCSGPGFCARHQVDKNELLWRKCATSLPHFMQGERRQMPQQAAQQAGVGPSALAPSPAAAPAASYDLSPCIHRGDEIRREECGPCGNKIKIKVLSCDVFGECAIGKTPSQGIRSCQGCERKEQYAKTKVLICNHQSLGDIAVLTAAVRELHQQYRGQFSTAFCTSNKELWEGSPWSVPLPEGEAGEEFTKREWHYDSPGTYASIHDCNQRPIHFFEAACEGLSNALGLPALRPKQQFAASIFLTEDEKSIPAPLNGRPYWLVMSGYKTDLTAKRWPFYQEVIERTPELNWIQVGALDKNTGMDHVNNPLSGVDNRVGATSIRELVRLVYHAQGVLCGVTGLMHLAHWVERPMNSLRSRAAVIVAGGREPTGWIAYPEHDVIHSIGTLPCCATGGCWKSRVRPLGDGSDGDKSLCVRPDGEFAECMMEISPALVAQHVLARAK